MTLRRGSWALRERNVVLCGWYLQKKHK